MHALGSMPIRVAQCWLVAGLLSVNLAMGQDGPGVRAARATLNTFPAELTPGVTPSPVPQVTLVTEVGDPLAQADVSIMTPTAGMAFASAKATTDDQGTAWFPQLHPITSLLHAEGALRIQVSRNGRWETVDEQAFMTVPGPAEQVKPIGTAPAVVRSGAPSGPERQGHRRR